MQVEGLVTATKNAHWLRVVPLSQGSEFSNAMIAAGEFTAGDQVIISITPAQNGHGGQGTSATTAAEEVDKS